MSMKIQISQQGIDASEERNAFHCATAKAFSWELYSEIELRNLIRIGNDCF